MSEPTVRTSFVRHEWDFPVTGSVQEVRPNVLRLVAWAKCARCLRLIASATDVQRPAIILPGQPDQNLAPLLNAQGLRLSLSPCPGKPDAPAHELPGAM